MFTLIEAEILPSGEGQGIDAPEAGAMVIFEGWVRNHNLGQGVVGLDYSCYPELAQREGEAILEESRRRFSLFLANCVHRIGQLQVGDIVVQVTVASAHRQECFAACSHIVEEIKRRVPIWKLERYSDGSTRRIDHA